MAYVLIKFNLNVHLSPTYEWETWNYEKENVDNIRGAINKLSWERTLQTTAKSIYSMQHGIIK